MKTPINQEQKGATLVNTNVFRKHVTLIYTNGDRYFRLIFKVTSEGLKFQKKEFISRATALGGVEVDHSNRVYNNQPVRRRRAFVD